MKKLIEIGTEKCDVVIIDSPPVLAASDPLVLATQCESTILVASAGTTERGALRSAQEMLQDVGANIGGVIFNRMDLSAASGGYRGYGYYGYDRDPYLAPQTKKKYSLLRKSA
jgi:Mrp family chromosome partitioning ATPase